MGTRGGFFRSRLTVNAMVPDVHPLPRFQIPGEVPKRLMTEVVRTISGAGHPGWQVRAASGASRSVYADCEALYLKSPVAYMPGERLICCLESPVMGEPGVVVSMEYDVEVLRMDVGADARFGIACRIHDWKCVAMRQRII